MTYTRGDYSIGVGMLPGLKKPCLYIGNKYCMRKVASFNSEEEAQLFIGWLEYFFRLKDSPRGGDE